MTNDILKNFENEIARLKQEYNINYSSIPYFGKASPLEVINQKNFDKYNMEFQIYIEDNYYNYVYIEAGRNPIPNMLCRTKDADELKYNVLKNLFSFNADIEARRERKSKHEIMLSFFKKINKAYALKYAEEYNL